VLLRVGFEEIEVEARLGVFTESAWPQWGGILQVDLALRGRAGALPAARLHPLVRDISRPAPGPDLLAFTELAAHQLKAAAEAAGETSDPRGPSDVVGLAAAGPARGRSAEQPYGCRGPLP
jgi:hypothetical protein